MSTLHSQDLFNLATRLRTAAATIRKEEYPENWEEPLFESLLPLVEEAAEQMVFTSLLEERYAHMCPDYYNSALRKVERMIRDGNICQLQ